MSPRAPLTSMLASLGFIEQGLNVCVPGLLTAVSPIWVKGMSPTFGYAGLIPFSLIF